VKRLLIANRGEIALRIARTARTMGIETVAVYSDADDGAPHVRFADYAERLGPAPASASYLDIDAVLRAVAATGADAVHPGYGFLAESPEFAERCEAAGLTFVGPPARAMRALGDKASSKRLLEGSGVPFLPGYHAEDQRDETLAQAAAAVGYPLMIKASAGGGGRGMRLVADDANFLAALQSARSEATAAFGNGNVLLERALDGPRHVEVQIFADAFGNVVHLGERDCSVQRRHQKLIEEAPSPAVDRDLRERLGSVAIEVARAAAYVGAGTVEFLLDPSGAFYFIEMNTRLQVEHPVTEAIFGLDLVEWQLRVARGEPLPRMQDAIVAVGHAIEARLCAEDPDRQFLPQTGTLVAWDPPLGVRVEHALEPGIVISPYYDSMIAKVIAYGETREDARVRLVAALERLRALGVTTNRTALVAYLRDERFVAGEVTTRFIEEGPALAVASEETLENAFALAAALAFALAADDGDFGPWAAWSCSALPASTVVLSLDDGPARSIAIGARTSRDVNARIGERTVAIAFASLDARAGHARYRLAGGPWQALAFARAAAQTFLSLDGRTFAFTDRSAQTSAPGAAAAGAGDGFLRAPMSGRVVAVSAASGAIAKAGSALVVLEAMKMEHALSLPIDARFGDVTAAAGMQVHANDILLAYEPVTGGATAAR
jgi:geranyl-CoA carboxylase alpha subunit